MNHEEMQKINSLNVFYAICDGCDTIQNLTERVGVSHATVEKICDELIDNDYITAKTESKQARGRRKVRYSLSGNRYSVYIEEGEDVFSCIFINTLLYATERFDKRRFHIYVPLGEVIKKIENQILSRDDFNLCEGIYIYCSDETEKLLPTSFTRIEKEDFIANFLKEKNEISIFEFPNKCILNVNGSLIHTNANRKEIEKVVKPQRVIAPEEPFYEEIFSSLQRATIEKMREKLLK